MLLEIESGDLDDKKVKPGQVIGMGKITELLNIGRKISRKRASRLLICGRS